jgi:hypothetical protein
MTRRRSFLRHLIERWIDTSCDHGGILCEGVGGLYDSWRRFAHDLNEERGSPTEFAQEIEARDFIADRPPPVSTGRIQRGRRLR